MKKPFFISTTIPYVNGDPHLGHGQEYIEADVIARYRRLLGQDVFFLAGTDENSLKNVQAAEKAGKSVMDFVSEKADNFYRFRDALNISFDNFIRTTEERHFLGAQKLWKLCEKDLYKKRYRGLYCVGCEAFYTGDELADGVCPEHKTAPDIVEEENYFFRLSAYQKDIEHALSSGALRVIPDNRKNEMLAMIECGLEDFSVSRSVERAHGWGVPVPGDPSQIMYVWFDALSNYINALNFATDGSLYMQYWVQGKEGREVVHVLGKGVARFHVVYWIGMLLSAGIPLPTEEFIHGYVTVDAEKMSKSLGNVVNPHDLVKTYGSDAVRYFFLGAIPAYADGDFTVERFEEYYTAHLANGIGNLTSRILTMLEKYTESKIPNANPMDEFHVAEFWIAYAREMRNYKFDAVIQLLNGLVAACDSAISTKKPWEAAKRGEDIGPFLSTLVETLRHLALALLPIIPGTVEKILSQLGIGASSLGSLGDESVWGKLKKGAIIRKGEILFPRLNTGIRN